MDVPTDLGQLCGTLTEFGLPRAIGHTSEGHLLLWNETFAQLAKLTEEQLRTAKISLSFDFARSSANQRLGLTPFALTISESTKAFLGHAVKRDDGFLLMMLDLTPADILLKYFWQGRVVGKEEKKKRLAEVIHDSFSPHLLAALFLISGIREHLAKTRSADAEQLARVAELLNETIQTLAAGVSNSDNSAAAMKSKEPQPS
jgi:signal transduction histidine kinase